MEHLRIAIPNAHLRQIAISMVEYTFDQHIMSGAVVVVDGARISGAHAEDLPRFRDRLAECVDVLNRDATFLTRGKLLRRIGNLFETVTLTRRPNPYLIEDDATKTGPSQIAPRTLTVHTISGPTTHRGTTDK